MNQSDFLPAMWQIQSSSNSSGGNISSSARESDYTDATGNRETHGFSNLGLSSSGQWQPALQVCTLSIILLSSLLVNCIVFIVFYRKPLLLTISNRFVLNLAASNFALSVIVMPQSLVAAITDRWILGYVWCQITGVMTTLLSAACIFTLLLIAVDRFYAIMKPLHYGMCITAQRAPLLLASVWIFSLVVAAPPLVGWNRIVYQRPLRLCSVDWEDQSVAGKTYTYSLVLVCFIIPFAVMLWVYITAFQQAKLSIAKVRRNSVTTDHSVDLAVAHAMLQRRRSSTVSLFQIVNSPLRRRSNASSCSSRRSLSINQGDDWKAAKTGFICMSTFTLCWLPFFVLITFLASADNDFYVPAWVGTSTMWVAFLSCTLNPMVYVFRSHAIRRQLLPMLCHGKHKQQFNERRFITSCPHSYPQMSTEQISRASSVVTFHTVDTRHAPLLQL